MWFAEEEQHLYYIASINYFYRVKKKIITLRVTKLGDWLQLDDYRERYDSINTLVLHSATTAYPVAVGGQVVQVNLRHPVYASYHH